jgi:hypothetical protein
MAGHLCDAESQLAHVDTSMHWLSVAPVRLALDERMLGPVPVASPLAPVIPVIVARETQMSEWPG